MTRIAMQEKIEAERREMLDGDGDQWVRVLTQSSRQNGSHAEFVAMVDGLEATRRDADVVLGSKTEKLGGLRLDGTALRVQVHEKRVACRGVRCISARSDDNELALVHSNDGIGIDNTERPLLRRNGQAERSTWLR